MLGGLVQVREEAEIAAVVNTGDDTVMHGLYICPDLDTITYTLSGSVNPETGWGLAGESWRAMDSLERLGGRDRTWFRLGDRDLGTHLYRTGRLAEGASLSQVTAEIARAFGLGLQLLPMTDDPVRTVLRRVGGGELAFQEYFVRHRHEVAVEAVFFVGARRARPTAQVLEALERADQVVVAPSNPVVSIGPILSLPGVRELLAARRSSVVAVSPIVGGTALKGPADRLLVELGGQASPAGVAERLTEVAGSLVIDEVDAAWKKAVEAAGMRAVVAPTVMSDPGRARHLAQVVLAAGSPG
jgi:LPPG:FO 2-phospho-L-lactate transferase